MSLAAELSALFARDLRRLHQEIAAFSDPTKIWVTVGGITNSSGHLVLHLEGNLREYVGRQLGSVAYCRNRPLEFASDAIPADELLTRINELGAIIPNVLMALDDEALSQPYPENVLGVQLSAREFLIHLHGHFNYHLGQIDYLRRTLTGESALQFATL